MNQVIETILQHRSIRRFEDRPLTDEQIRTIVECAQAASTSSYVQAYSIIGVKDPEKNGSSPSWREINPMSSITAISLSFALIFTAMSSLAS